MGDVVSKIQIASRWLEIADDETAENYAAEHFQILRSMVPLVREQHVTDVRDELLAAITTYRQAAVAFENNTPTATEEIEARADATYRPAEKLLLNWSQSAQTLAASIEALKLAKDELADFYPHGLARPMVSAALGYLVEQLSPPVSQ